MNIYAVQTRMGLLFATGDSEASAAATVRSFDIAPLAVEFVARDDARGKAKAQRIAAQRAG
jgi:hypothetical protein